MGAAAGVDIDLIDVDDADRRHLGGHRAARLTQPGHLCCLAPQHLFGPHHPPCANVGVHRVLEGLEAARHVFLFCVQLDRHDVLLKAP